MDLQSNQLFGHFQLLLSHTKSWCQDSGETDSHLCLFLLRFWIILPQFSRTLKTLQCSGLSNRWQEVWIIVKNYIYIAFCWILWCSFFSNERGKERNWFYRSQFIIHCDFPKASASDLLEEIEQFASLFASFAFDWSKFHDRLWFYWAHGTQIFNFYKKIFTL